jgi:hypothetical protein
MIAGWLRAQSLAGAPPPRSLVAAALGGLAAAAVGLPVAALAGALGWPLRPRAALLLAALLGLVWGLVRVHDLDRRTLREGAFSGEVVVSGRPSGSHAIAQTSGAATSCSGGTLFWAEVKDTSSWSARGRHPIEV